MLTDEIHGGEGDDTIQGGEGSDIIFGEEGNDFLFADSPNSAISLLVNQQNLTLEDSIGREFHLQDPVIQTIEEEELIDIIRNELVSTISINIFNLDISIQVITNNLQKTNNDNNNEENDDVQLSGGSGNDYLFGGSGNDILAGGLGKDFFDCNEGIDIILDFDLKEDTANNNCEEI